MRNHLMTSGRIRQYHVSATSTLNTTICGRMRNREDVQCAAVLDIEWRIAPAEEAEHERGSRACCGFDGIHHVVGQQQRFANWFEAQQRERQHELHRQSDGDRAHADVAAVFADEPCQPEQNARFPTVLACRGTLIKRASVPGFERCAASRYYAAAERKGRTWQRVESFC